LDAIRAGREALSRDHLACPRQRGQREALRVLHLTRSGRSRSALMPAGTSRRCWSPPPSRCGPSSPGGPGFGKPGRARPWSPHPPTRSSTGPRCGRCG
jgi:hypothetical protein